MLNCYPNPFNSAVQIQFAVPNNTAATISIYNLAGQKIKTVLTGSAQTHTVMWNGTSELGTTVSSGMYLVVMQVGSELKDVKKIVFLK